MYLPIVILSSKDNVKLAKTLEDGFNRPVHWNEYETKIHTKNLDNSNPIRFFLDAFLLYKELEDCLFLLLTIQLQLILIAIDLSKQKELDAHWRAIQQIEFYGTGKTNSQLCTNLEKWKNSTRIFKRSSKSVVTTYKWLNTVKWM